MPKRQTALQMAVIDALAQGMKRAEVAALCKCNIQTVDRIKADKELKQLYYERCNEQIKELVPQAIKLLGELITDETQQGAVKIAAIREVLERSHIADLTDTADNDINITVKYE